MRRLSRLGTDWALPNGALPTLAKAPKKVSPELPRKPFIVWVLPGSGGHWVAKSLASLCSQVLVKINSLDDDHSYENKTTDKQEGNKKSRQYKIRNLLKNKPSLMFEVSDKNDTKFISNLAKSTTNAGYQHILLYRRNTLYRLLLVHHARNQRLANFSDSTMSPLNFTNLRKSNEREIANLLLVSHLAPKKMRFTIALEDIFLQNNEQQPARPNRFDLLNFLGLNVLHEKQGIELLTHITDIDPPLVQLTHYPGFDDFQHDSQLIPGFEEGRAMVIPQVEPLAESNGVALFHPRRGSIPPIIRDGFTFKIGGIALPPKDFDADSGTKLQVTQGNQETKVEWGLPSPKALRVFPEHPRATSSRYADIEVCADSHAPVFISLCNSQEQEVKLACIRFKNNGHEAIAGIFIKGNCPPKEWSIGYLPIPKVASTSIYNGLYKLVKGQYYQDEEGVSWRVHQYFHDKRTEISGAKFRFVVVRDPVKRFLSGYVNRVLMSKQLSRAKIKKLPIAQNLDLEKFPYNPSLSDFIRHFDFYYQTVPTIKHHFRPQHELIINRNQFDRIYPIEKLSQLPDDIKTHCGVTLELRREMKSNLNLSVSTLRKNQFDKIVNFYTADYEMLADLYSPQSLM